MVDGTRPGLNTVREAAARLKLHPKTVEDLIKTGELGHVRIGRRVFATDDQIQALIDAHTVPGDYDEPRRVIG